MLAKNKSGWTLLEYLKIKENEIAEYNHVTGAFALIKVRDKYLIGYNDWRGQWEFPAGHIEIGETARQAAVRELYEETHQINEELEFNGLAKVMKLEGKIGYQAVFTGSMDKIEPFFKNATDEMDRIMLWDLRQDIGYVDECDLKIVELACLQMKGLQLLLKDIEYIIS